MLSEIFHYNNNITNSPINTKFMKPRETKKVLRNQHLFIFNTIYISP